MVAHNQNAATLKILSKYFQATCRVPEDELQKTKMNFSFDIRSHQVSY